MGTKKLAFWAVNKPIGTLNCFDQQTNRFMAIRYYKDEASLIKLSVHYIIASEFMVY